MEIFDYLVGFFHFLIPGLISWTIFCSLKSYHEKDDFLKYAYPFTFSAISFLLSDWVIRIINFVISFLQQRTSKLSGVSLLNSTKLMDLLSLQKTNVSEDTMIASILISILLGFLAVYVEERHLLFRLAGFFRITDRQDNDRVWDHVFYEQDGKKDRARLGDRWVYFRDHQSGKIYWGCVVKWSDKRDIIEVKMKNVTVYGQKNLKYKLKYVYLARNPGEFTMEFPEREQPVVMEYSYRIRKMKE